MAEDGGPRPKEDSKLFGKHKWRGKMFSKSDAQSKSGKDEGGMSDDVMDFLRPTVNTNAPRPPTGNPSANLGRIDVQKASRWPAAAEVGGHNGLQTPARLSPYDQTTQRPGSSGNSYMSRDSVERSPTHAEAVRQSTSLRRPKKNKNLTVGFSSRPPEIIGEGGDEAELPAIDVAKSSPMPRSPGRGPAGHDGPPNHDAAEPPLGKSLRPLPIKRRPTGLDEVPGGAEGAKNMAEYDSDDDQSPVPGRASQESFSNKDSGLARSFVEKVRAKMQQEEGNAMHEGATTHSPADAGPDGFSDLPPRYVQDSSRPDYRDDLAPSPNYSLRPTPSPQPTQLDQPSPISLVHRQLSESQPRVGSTHATGYQNKAPSTSQYSIRSATTALGDGALDEFSTRVSHYNTLFHMAAESIKPIAETPFAEWVRTATWWFLKGRGDLETAMRSRASDQGPRVPLQAYVDLAKAWWILQRVLPQHPEARRYGSAPMNQLISIARQAQDDGLADSIEMHQAIVTNLRGLAMSMKRNEILPPLQEHSQLAPGLDTSVWIKYPFFTPEVCSQLSGTSSQSLVLQAPKKDSAVKDDMPLGDSKENFSYGRYFVDVYISGETNAEQEFRLPCLISVVRERTDWLVNAMLTSQNGLVNLRIQAQGKNGLTWDDVRWRSRQFSLQIDLKRGLSLTVQFSEKDFKSFWNIYEYSTTVEESLQPEPGESLLSEQTLKSFRYIDPDPKSKAFPKEAVPRCRMRLFEQKVTISEGTGTRKVHRGYRMVVITSPRVKTLGRASQSFTGEKCVQFGFLRGEDGGPALLLQSNVLNGTMILSFHDLAERSLLHSLITAVAVQPQETLYADLSLKRLSIEQKSQAKGFSQSGADALGSLEWQKVQVINKDPDPDHDYGKTVLSDELRIVASSNVATLTDRMSLGPGQLQIRLDVGSAADIKVLRFAQEDMTVCIAEGQGNKNLPNTLSETLKMIRSTETVRSFSFETLKDLHAFQAAITGFAVLFDGMASSFAIARRRMVVPIYKKWDSNMSRLQVIKQERVTQLVVFFADFGHGYCMNFVLKGTDVFESFSRSGKYYVRFVDAKFALPKGDEDTSSQFVCLDMPEYPAEHDDITIAFDSQAARDSFQEALPAPTKPVSRMPSLRK